MTPKHERMGCFVLVHPAGCVTFALEEQQRGGESKSKIRHCKPESLHGCVLCSGAGWGSSWAGCTAQQFCSLGVVCGTESSFSTQKGSRCFPSSV